MNRQADFTIERRAALTLSLPWPPTTNNLRAIFAWIEWLRGKPKARGRLITTAEARAYALALQAHILSTYGPQKPFDGRLAVCITTYQPTAARCDIANREKALIDGLVACCVMHDDEQIDDLRIVRGGIDRLNPHVEVVVRQL